MFLILVLALVAPGSSLSRPNKTTPGAIRPLTRTQVCSTKWGLDKRHVTLSMKKHVALAYGIPWSQHSRYEFDHLIPRELGGADLESNLWPQPYEGTFNAHQKDKLENFLHKSVCEGKMTLEFAQESIRTDWIASFRLYIN